MSELTWFKRQQQENKKFLKEKNLVQQQGDLENKIKEMFVDFSQDKYNDGADLKRLFQKYGHEYIFFCPEEILNKRADDLIDLFLNSLQQKYKSVELEKEKQKYIYLAINHTSDDYPIHKWHNHLSELDEILSHHTVNDERFNKEKLLAKLSTQGFVNIASRNDGQILLGHLYQSLSEQDFDTMLGKFEHETEEDYQLRKSKTAHNFAQLSIQSDNLSNKQAELYENCYKNVLKSIQKEKYIQLFKETLQTKPYWNENTIQMSNLIMSSKFVDIGYKRNLIKEINEDKFKFKQINTLKVFDAYIDAEKSNILKNNEKDINHILNRVSEVFNKMTDHIEKENYAKFPHKSISPFIRNALSFFQMVEIHYDMDLSDLKKEQLKNAIRISLNSKEGIRGSECFMKSSPYYYEEFFEQKELFDFLNDTQKTYPFGFIGFDRKEINKEVFTSYLMNLGQKPITNFKSTFQGLMELHGMETYIENICGSLYRHENERNLIKNWCNYYRKNKDTLDSINAGKLKEHIDYQYQNNQHNDIKSIMMTKQNVQDFFNIVSEHEYEEHIDMYRRMENDCHQKNFFHRFLAGIQKEEPAALYGLWNNEELFYLINGLSGYQKSRMINEFLLNKDNPHYEEALILVQNKIKNNDDLRRMVFDLDPIPELIEKLNADENNHLKNKNKFSF